MKKKCEELGLKQKLDYQIKNKDECKACKDNRKCTFKLLEI